jgi:uncharacterized repeat protein (TIGR03803 family)
MNKLSTWKTICVVCVFCMAQAVGSRAQTPTTLLSFDKTNGADPDFISLVQGTDGNFYGTTYEGGAHDYGTVFKITPAGTLTTLYSFCTQTNCTDGEYPAAGLVPATNGNFYGTTAYGGADSAGTVFEISPSGKLTTLHSFCSESGCADGEVPYDALVQATNGNFYGTTLDGGDHSEGTVFEITPSGKLTTIYSFCAQADCTDGAYPYAGLVQATNGNFYGTTNDGGANRYYGSVFQITPAGKLTTLHSFNSSDAGEGSVVAGLVQASNGNFYGTTFYGGADNDGTVYEITAGGAYTLLHSFDYTDSGRPYAGLIQATNGNLYGTSWQSDHGIFEITTGGKLGTLYSFCAQSGCPSSPTGGLVQATNGTFYGTTYYGGAHSYGTVFSLAVGLGPFVKTDPTSGAVGTTVTILGNNLTGSSSVTFNGTAGTFKVISSTEITTTVPKGATTGLVKVKTPSTTLSSNVSFRVP